MTKTEASIVSFAATTVIKTLGVDLVVALSNARDQHPDIRDCIVSDHLKIALDEMKRLRDVVDADMNNSCRK